jgi:hypothetical protein
VTAQKSTASTTGNVFENAAQKVTEFKISVKLIRLLHNIPLMTKRVIKLF